MRLYHDPIICHKGILLDRIKSILLAHTLLGQAKLKWWEVVALGTTLVVAVTLASVVAADELDVVLDLEL